jgi:hypothetical protein
VHEASGVVMTPKVFLAVVSLMQADTKLKLGWHSWRMKSDTTEAYLVSASRMFLEGSTSPTPLAAVMAGERSLREWCECLNYARFLYSDSLEPTDGFDDLSILS